MVGGADKLCDYLADGKQTVRVEVIASKVSLPLSDYGLLTKNYSNPFNGVGYDAAAFEAFTDIIQCTGFSCEFFVRLCFSMYFCRTKLR